MSVQAIKTIDGIQFSIWSPTEIRKYSVAEITAPETYDEDGMPVQGGLMDGRLGTLEPGQKCLTCGNTAARCPGHFGHIELAEPILHIAFIDNIYKLLQSTCRSCARLKVPQDDLNAFKKIKDKHYAYLVKNTWVRGKTKQKVVKYLGRVLDLDSNSNNKKDKELLREMRFHNERLKELQKYPLLKDYQEEIKKYIKVRKTERKNLKENHIDFMIDNKKIKFGGSDDAN